MLSDGDNYLSISITNESDGQVNNCEQFLSHMLKVLCNVLKCYGESFLYASDELKYCESSFQFATDLPDAIEVMALAAEGTSFIDGVGLPGDCKTKRVVEIHNLKLLILDGYFDIGGSRLLEFADKFKLACTIPVIVPRQNADDFLGVVVLYLPFDLIELEPLRAYLNAFAQSIAPSYVLFEKQVAVTASFVRCAAERKASSIAIELSRKASKASSVGNKLELGDSVSIDCADVEGEKQKRPLTYDLLVEKTLPWVNRYLRKWKGGNNTLPGPLEDKYCVAGFVDSFVAIAVLQLMFDKINDVFVFHGVQHMFLIPSSFGALCTIVFALPAAPLGQPRIIYMAHTWAMAVSIVIMNIFEQHQYVWLQAGLAAGITVAGMAKFGILNPPSGAISLALIVYANSTSFTQVGLLFNIVSTYMCCTVIILVGMLFHNVLRDRAYPTVL